MGEGEEYVQNVLYENIFEIKTKYQKAIFDRERKERERT